MQLRLQAKRCSCGWGRSRAQIKAIYLVKIYLLVTNVEKYVPHVMWLKSQGGVPSVAQQSWGGEAKPYISILNNLRTALSTETFSVCAHILTFGRVFAKHFRGGRVSQSYLKPFDLNPTVLGAIGKPFPIQGTQSWFCAHNLWVKALLQGAYPLPQKTKIQ